MAAYHQRKILNRINKREYIDYQMNQWTETADPNNPVELARLEEVRKAYKMNKEIDAKIAAMTTEQKENDSLSNLDNIISWLNIRTSSMQFSLHWQIVHDLLKENFDECNDAIAETILDDTLNYYYK